VPVNATLVDRVTLLPIASGTPSQITLCTRRADFCMSPVVGESGSAVTGFGLPGPSYLKVFAIGYVLNTTPIADIPNLDQTVDLGTIYLVPAAAVKISTNVTGGRPSVRGRSAISRRTSARWMGGDGVPDQPEHVPPLLAVHPPRWPSASVPGNTYGIGNTTLLAAPPLRDVIILIADSGVYLSASFPVATNRLFSVTPLFRPRTRTSAG